MLMDLDRDPDEIKDLRERYRPLAVLLDDAVVKELFRCGKPEAARELRRKQRARYYQLLTSFERDSRALKAHRAETMKKTRAWQTADRALTNHWLRRTFAIALRGAGLLHALHIPGAAPLARAAAVRVELCLPPPANVVPIRVSL